MTTKARQTVDETAGETRERARVAKLSDAEVLKAAGGGAFGPGIIGRPLFDRAQAILKRSGNGVFGPAITDDEYGEVEAKALNQRRAQIRADREAARAKLAEQVVQREPASYDPADLTQADNPWTYVTLSGAKQLAMTAGVSYVARVKRVDLIAELQAQGVTPPPVPSPDDLAGDEGEG